MVAMTTKGTRKKKRDRILAKGKKQTKPLTPQEKALCLAVVDVLLERHRDRKAGKGG